MKVPARPSATPGSPPAMGFGLNRIQIGGVFALTLLLAACNGQDPAAGGAAPPPKVSVAPAISRTVTLWDEFNGRIRAIDAVEIRPRISGYVQSIAYKEGDEVRKGDVLFLIDQRPYRAALNSANARLERVRATLGLAQSQDRRAQTLLTANAISKEEAESRRSAYAQGLADVHEAEAAVALAKLNLEFTEVRAPIDGRVSRAMLTVGNLAVADQTQLTSMVSQNPVYVYFDPDEHSFLRYSAQANRSKNGAIGTKVRVGLANDTEFSHSGTVDFVDNQVNPATGTIQVRARLDNTDRAFTPGLFARVKYAGDTPADVILIDNKAVLTDQNRKYVYVLGPGDKALRKEVELGGMSDGLRVIDKGLAPGDKVIVAGVQHIFYAGAPVTPTEVPMAAAAGKAPAADVNPEAAGNAAPADAKQDAPGTPPAAGTKTVAAK